MRSLTSDQKFEMNKSAIVGVKTKVKHGVFHTTVTVSHTIVDTKPLILRSHAEIVEFVKSIDLSDDQVGLFDGNGANSVAIA